MEAKTDKKIGLSAPSFFPQFYYLLLSLLKIKIVNELTDEREIKKLAYQLIESMTNSSSEIEKLSPEEFDKFINTRRVRRLPLEKNAKEKVYSQGMHVYLPLTNGVVSFVNGNVYDPKPFESLVLVLPGDVHRHISRNGTEPAIVLTMNTFGLTWGHKVKFNAPNSERFPSIKRHIRIK